MITINNLYKSYSNEKYVVNNLNFKINKGEIVALIGHNGARKTTTLKMLTGVLKPTKGDIKIFNEDINVESLTLKKKINYIPDKPIVLLEFTGNEYLEFITNLYGVNLEKEEEKEKLNYLLSKFKLEKELNNVLFNYSQGMRKKIMIIAAFLSNAKLLILDEPLTGLDPEAIYIVKELLKDYKKKGNIVIFSTHLLDIAENICDKFFIMNKGKQVFFGDIKELQKSYGKNISLEKAFIEVINNGEN